MPKDDHEVMARGATLFGTGKRNAVKNSKRKKRPYDKKYFESNKPHDEHYIKDIIKLVESKGLKIDFYKDKYIVRRTRSRVSRTKTGSYKEYLELLKRDPKELDELKDALSINVTRFFRNNDSWEEFRANTIPSIVEQKRKEGSNTVRIWSAGCAVGAEPYSLSIITNSGQFQDMDFKITASDINQDLLKIARNGIYDTAYLDEMNKAEILESFDIMRKDTYRVKSKLKRKVTFSQIDLTKDRFPTNVDMILCRNVMIYLTRDAQDVIKKKFLSSLNPGGYLVLGRTETLSGTWRGQFESISTRHRIYKKKSSILG